METRIEFLKNELQKLMKEANNLNQQIVSKFSEARGDDTPEIKELQEKCNQVLLKAGQVKSELERAQ